MEKVTIGVEQVLQHLKDGKTREDIANIYGITKGECKILFQDPRLKGKKTIKKPSFILVQDETELTEEKTTALIEEIVDNHENVSSEKEETTEEVKSNFGDTTTDEVETEEEVEEQEVMKATWD